MKRENRERLARIVARGVELLAEAGIQAEKLDLMMDLEAAHGDIPLDFARLEGFGDGDFGHDITGIQRHLNRETKRIEDFFVPRCSQPERTPRRRPFIDELRQHIAKNVPGAPDAVMDSIDAWSDGGEPEHPFEAAVFAVCDQVANDLDGKKDEAAPDGCTNPGGHEWDKTAGEADEARIRGDHANDSIRCIHCDADGDS